MIELRRVWFSYGSNFSLRDLTLSLGDGVTALVGPNGSGKTTILKLAAGLLKPLKGSVLVEGLDLWGPGEGRQAEARRAVVYVHENPAMFRGSVAENVAYGLRLRGLRGREVEERVEESLRLLGISGLKERPARELSKGQKQRVALARAVAVRPRHLLLDEPTANLDLKGRRLFAELLRALEGQGTSVAIATHDYLLASRLAGRVVALEDGRIVAEGRPEEVLEREAA